MENMICEECEKELEFYRSSEEVQANGTTRFYEEYLCRPCRTFVKFELVPA